MDIKDVEAAFSGTTKKSRLSKTIEDLLNKQIGIELGAVQLYRAMGYWCNWTGLSGTSKFLLKHAEEELLHMNKLAEYLLDRNALAKMPNIKAELTNFSDLKTVLEKGREHEIMVTNSYQQAKKIACDEEDYVTEEFFRWYLKEQVEEEAIFLSLLDRLEIIGNDKRGQYFLDLEIGEMV